MYDKSRRPGKATWTCINKELGETFHSFTHFGVSHVLRNTSRACATLGGESRVYLLVGLAISFGWDFYSKEIIYL